MEGTWKLLLLLLLLVLLLLLLVMVVVVRSRSSEVLQDDYRLQALPSPSAGVGRSHSCEDAPSTVCTAMNCAIGNGISHCSCQADGDCMLAYAATRSQWRRTTALVVKLLHKVVRVLL